MRDSTAMVNNSMIKRIASKEQTLNRNSTDAINKAIKRNTSKE